MSGLSATGFAIKSVSTIIDEIIVSVEAVYGPINQNDDGVIRQIIGIFAEREGLLWEEAEAIYLSYHPSTAESVSLDNVADLTGITRIAAAKSTATCIFEGLNGGAVSITAGSQVSSSTTSDVFEIDTTTTIAPTSIVRGEVRVSIVADSALYRITIDAVDYDFTADASATEQEIKDGLIAALASGSAPMTGTDLGGAFIQIESTDLTTDYSVTVFSSGGGLLDLLQIFTPIAVTALVAGAKLVNAGQIDTIVTPISGWDSVEQLIDGVQGRETETDAELRIRITRVRLGAGTVEALRSRIFDEVVGVTSINVIENATDGVVAGQPAHSVHVIVAGGTNQDVADKIWEIKPAGIATYGGTAVVVVDGGGTNQTVNFSRPTTQYAWVRITYTTHSEETFPTDGQASIAASILAYGNTFAVGQDMLWQRFIGPTFDTPGLELVQVELDTTAGVGGPPSYVVDTDVAVADDDIATFDASRIFVVEAP